MLPSWYGLTDDFTDIPSNALIYVPESHRLFHVRGSQTAQGRAIGDLVNLCQSIAASATSSTKTGLANWPDS